MFICDIGAERLLIAIYTSVCSDLLQAYERLDKCPTEEGKNAARFDARMLEKWILSDPYGFLPDPQGIVKAVRKKHRQGGKTVKCPDFAKEGGKTLRKMEYRQIRMSILTVSR